MAFDYQFVGLVKIVLHMDPILCNGNQMLNIGIFKNFKVSFNVPRFKFVGDRRSSVLLKFANVNLSNVIVNVKLSKEIWHTSLSGFLGAILTDWLCHVNVFSINAALTRKVFEGVTTYICIVPIWLFWQI